jgi:hypothetical protein
MRTFTIILLSGFLACNANGRTEKVEHDQPVIDSTIVSVKTTNILGEEYRGVGTSEYRIIVLNSNGDTVLNEADLYFDFEFSDFNGDSLKDIVVHPLTNVPGIQNLLLFDKEKMAFTRVSGFEKFPDPKPIQGTDYYYSYHRSGCADNFWDSDLFYIDGFETKLLGNISGNECEGEKGIVVSKSVDGEKKIVTRLSVDILEKFDNGKWGFIAGYWTRNYSKFVR